MTDSIWFPDLDDKIPKQIRKANAFYESDLLEHLFFCVPSGGIIVDVGANIGNHTVFFSKYMASLVVAIEPHPDTFRLLTSTVARNELGNVLCIQTAAGSASGRATLSLPEGYDGNTGSFCITKGALGQHPVEVPVDTLDAIVSERLQDRQGQVTLIKIDVEGYEQEVLRGAPNILRTVKPHLVVEAQSSEQLQRFITELRPLGYRCIGCFCATPTYHFAPWSALHHIHFRLCKRIARLFGLKHWRKRAV